MAKRTFRSPAASAHKKTVEGEFNGWKDAPVPALDAPDAMKRIGEKLAKHARPGSKPPDERE